MESTLLKKLKVEVIANKMRMADTAKNLKGNLELAAAEVKITTELQQREEKATPSPRIMPVSSNKNPTRREAHTIRLLLEAEAAAAETIIEKNSNNISSSSTNKLSTTMIMALTVMKAIKKEDSRFRCNSSLEEVEGRITEAQINLTGRVEANMLLSQSNSNLKAVLLQSNTEKTPDQRRQRVAMMRDVKVGTKREARTTRSP